MTGKMMIGLAAAAIVAAASATGASAQGRGNFPGKYTCGWMDSPIRLPSGRWVDGQVSRCGRDVYASERTCRGERWRYLDIRTAGGRLTAGRWCPGGYALPKAEGQEEE